MALDHLRPQFAIRSARRSSKLEIRPDKETDLRFRSVFACSSFSVRLTVRVSSNTLPEPFELPSTSKASFPAKGLSEKEKAGPSN
jgi:hypothetical protein